MHKQYIIKCKDNTERKYFYDYLIGNNFKPVEKFKHKNFIDNVFPFVVEPNNTFWICESITCCAAAASCGAIITVDEYFKCIKDQRKSLSLKKAPKKSE